jgi:uncharacterized protein YlzI (FlbEa/FlbD family)
MLKNKYATTLLGSLSLLTAAVLPMAHLEAKHQESQQPAKGDSVRTEAGDMDLSTASSLGYLGAYHTIDSIAEDRKTVTLDDGSVWAVSTPDVTRSWGPSNRLVITQNHLLLSIDRFALANVDIATATSASHLILPNPAAENAYFIDAIDYPNSKVTLNDGSQWIVHSSDHSVIKKMLAHHRIIVGANTAPNECESPYLLIDIDTGSSYVRASNIEPHLLGN